VPQSSMEERFGAGRKPAERGTSSIHPTAEWSTQKRPPLESAERPNGPMRRSPTHQRTPPAHPAKKPPTPRWCPSKKREPDTWPSRRTDPRRRWCRTRAAPPGPRVGMV